MPNLPTALLAKDGSVRPNDFQFISAEAPIPEGNVIVSIDRLNDLQSITGQKALYLTPEVAIEQIIEMQSMAFKQFDAILIEFESFVDGRGYSIATLLRRNGFSGELWAVGDIFQDTLNYLKRCGFDYFALRTESNLEHVSSGLDDFEQGYQFSTAQSDAYYQTGKTE